MTLHTAGGSPISGKTVTLSATAGSPSISPAASITNTSGQALFYVTDSQAESDTLQVRDTTDGVTVTQTAGITFTSSGGSGASASASSLSASPSSFSTGATSDVIVTLDTAGGSPLSGKSVTLRAIAGTPGISPSSSVTNSTGQALFYVTDSKTESDTVQVKDNTDNVTVTQTAGMSFAAPVPSASTSHINWYPSTPTVGTTADVIVTFETAGESPLANKTVTLKAMAGSPTITPPTSVTNSTGAVLFYVTDSRVENDTLQAKDITDNFTLTQSGSTAFVVAARAAVASAAPSCATVSAALVNAALGANAKAPSQQTSNTGTACSYGGSHNVTVSYRQRQSPTAPAAGSSRFESLKGVAAPGSGAYAFVIPASTKRPATQVLVVLVNSTYFTIAASGVALSQEVALAKKVVPLI